MRTMTTVMSFLLTMTLAASVDYVPTISPTVTGCVDNTSFYLRDNNVRTCLWASFRPEVRCSKSVDKEDAVKANCPVACGMCPTASPTNSPTSTPTSSPSNSPTSPTTSPSFNPTPNPTMCEDSYYFYMEGHPTRTCEWARKDPNDRCDRLVDVHKTVKENCPRSCGTCYTTTGPVNAPTINPTPWRDECSDNPSFVLERDLNDGLFNNAQPMTCEWASKDPEGRCNKPTDHQKAVMTNCPESCGLCGPSSSYSYSFAFAVYWENHPYNPDNCQDSPTYFMADFPYRNCDWASKNPFGKDGENGYIGKGRCERPVDRDNEVALNCRVSCGLCPTSSPTAMPTAEPSPEPTAPTKNPTNSPTPAPTSAPTPAPTSAPTSEPTAPTFNPTLNPTDAPTNSPTLNPTFNPTNAPTVSPTNTPTAPTFNPTSEPTSTPTTSPTESPTCSGDSTTFISDHNDKSRGCDWVAKNPELRCTLNDLFYEYCPSACGTNC